MMTDEQYIDWLFKQEPCGYQNTPGFRAFLLDAMAVIGERPRTGEVASMHMAYTAGQEHGIARTWTDERPSEPGEYWLSLRPDQRQGAMATDGAVAECRLAPNARMLSGRDRYGAWSMSIDDPMLDGAKWSRRETPADPFEVTG